MQDNKYIDVVCLVTPTGETLWFKESKGFDYMKKVIEKWKAEHPEMLDTPCTMGSVNITMPQDRFAAISACSGPGFFEWP